VILDAAPSTHRQQLLAWQPTRSWRPCLAGCPSGAGMVGGGSIEVDRVGPIHVDRVAPDFPSLPVTRGPGLDG
jgi:hypothetical protein